MKRLTLLRHAKSDWDDPVARDFDRPLNKRGARAASTMGQFARSRKMHFDQLVASPAVRVVETLERFHQGFGSRMEAAWDRRIYLASAETLLDVVHDFPNDADDVLMAGHNPGLEDLVVLLVRQDEDSDLLDAVEEKFPTASIAVMEFDVDRWEDVSPASARLKLFTRPRDLDPTLGPDQPH